MFDVQYFPIVTAETRLFWFLGNGKLIKQIGYSLLICRCFSYQHFMFLICLLQKVGKRWNWIAWDCLAIACDFLSYGLVFDDEVIWNPHWWLGCAVCGEHVVGFRMGVLWETAFDAHEVLLLVLCTLPQSRQQRIPWRQQAYLLVALHRESSPALVSILLLLDRIIPWRFRPHDLKAILLQLRLWLLPLTPLVIRAIKYRLYSIHSISTLKSIQRPKHHIHLLFMLTSHPWPIPNNNFLLCPSIQNPIFHIALKSMLVSILKLQMKFNTFVRRIENDEA